MGFHSEEIAGEWAQARQTELRSTQCNAKQRRLRKMQSGDSRSRTSSASTSALDLRTAVAPQSFSIQSLLAPVGAHSQNASEVLKSDGQDYSASWQHSLRLPNLPPPVTRKTRVTSALPEEISRSFFQRFSAEGGRKTTDFPSMASGEDGAGSSKILEHGSHLSGKANIYQDAVVADNAQLEKTRETLSPSIKSDFSQPPGLFSNCNAKLAVGEVSIPVWKGIRPSAPEPGGPIESKGIRGYWDTVLIPSSPCSGLRRFESNIEKKRKGLLAVAMASSSIVLRPRNEAVH